ncbi:MAG: hypothetical protein LBI06_01735, partial [Treponema sp.]|nr:hypothetical protein [Treponema sp.]
PFCAYAKLKVCLYCCVLWNFLAPARANFLGATPLAGLCSQARGAHANLKVCYHCCVRWIFLAPERANFSGKTPLDGAQLLVPPFADIGRR